MFSREMRGKSKEMTASRACGPRRCHFFGEISSNKKPRQKAGAKNIRAVRPGRYFSAGVLSFFISRLLRRAALLGWMTPLRAATSRALMAAMVAAFTSSGVASRAARTALRVCGRVVLLITRWRVLDRTRLMAAAVVANGNSPHLD